MKRFITLITLLTLLTIGLQAQIIDATNNSTHKQEKTSSNSPIYKPTGHYLRYEGGLLWGSVAYDYQINPYIMVGGGVGVGIGYYNAIAPIYAEAVFSTPRNKWSLYAEIKLGYETVEASFFPSLTVGANYKNLGLGIGGYYCSHDGSYYYDFLRWESRFVVTYKLPLKVFKGLFESLM